MERTNYRKRLCTAIESVAGNYNLYDPLLLHHLGFGISAGACSFYLKEVMDKIQICEVVGRNV